MGLTVKNRVNVFIVPCGEAHPASPEVHDLARDLTKLSEVRAQACRGLLSRFIPFDFVGVPMTARARKTASIVAGIGINSDDIWTISSLFPEKVRKVLEGGKFPSLRDFFRKSNKEARGIMHEFGQSEWETILGYAGEHNNLLFCTNPLCCSSIAFHACIHARTGHEAKRFLDHQVQGCEAIMFALRGGRVVRHRIVSPNFSALAA